LRRRCSDAGDGSGPAIRDASHGIVAGASQEQVGRRDGRGSSEFRTFLARFAYASLRISSARFLPAAAHTICAKAVARAEKLDRLRIGASSRMDGGYPPHLEGSARTSARDAEKFNFLAGAPPDTYCSGSDGARDRVDPIAAGAQPLTVWSGG